MLEPDEAWAEAQLEAEQRLWDAPRTSWDAINTQRALEGLLGLDDHHRCT